MVSLQHRRLQSIVEADAGQRAGEGGDVGDGDDAVVKFSRY